VYSSAVREGFIELTKKTVLDNAKVLEEKAKDVLEEAEGLIDDAWKYGEVEDKNMQLYVIGILQPMAYGVYIDLLLGNLPAFFVDLRLLLESLACCYMVKFSLEDPSLGIARPDVSASKILREFGKATSLGKKPNELWGKLSNNWCHALKMVPPNAPLKLSLKGAWKRRSSNSAGLVGGISSLLGKATAPI
jgi:hypothetical protein